MLTIDALPTRSNCLTTAATAVRHRFHGHQKLQRPRERRLELTHALPHDASDEQTHSDLTANRTSREGSSILALHRARESASASPLFLDPYAMQLSEQILVEHPNDGMFEYDIITTKYIDDALMNAVSLVNMDVKSEHRQVVLLGCGMDTRPFRLLWPAGTLMFNIAPPEVHEVAEAVLTAGGVRVQRGCLLRRVPANLQVADSFEAALERGGYRGDRLSVWALQGLRHIGVGVDAIRQILCHVCNMAAYGSIVLGELPPMTRQAAENILGECGLLGNVIEFGSEDADFGVWTAAGNMARMEEMERGDARDAPFVVQEAGSAGVVGDGSGTGDEGERVQPFLFSAQHQHLSLVQMELYQTHSAAAEEADEDFFGNFS